MQIVDAKHMRGKLMVPSNHDITLGDDAYGWEAVYQELRTHQTGSPSHFSVLERAIIWHRKHRKPWGLTLRVDCDIVKKKWQFILPAM